MEIDIGKIKMLAPRMGENRLEISARCVLFCDADAADDCEIDRRDSHDSDDTIKFPVVRVTLSNITQRMRRHKSRRQGEVSAGTARTPTSVAAERMHGLRQQSSLSAGLSRIIGYGRHDNESTPISL